MDFFGASRSFAGFLILVTVRSIDDAHWMLISDPVFYLTAIPAVLLYGMAKGGLGGAAGAIAVPLKALAIDPVRAAAILLPIICVMDFFALKTFWKNYDTPSLRILLPASLVGVVIGPV